jgi:hypothetical protein
MESDESTYEISQDVVNKVYEYLDDLMQAVSYRVYRQDIFSHDPDTIREEISTLDNAVRECAADLFFQLAINKNFNVHTIYYFFKSTSRPNMVTYEDIHMFEFAALLCLGIAYKSILGFDWGYTQRIYSKLNMLLVDNRYDIKDFEKWESRILFNTDFKPCKETLNTYGQLS